MSTDPLIVTVEKLIPGGRALAHLGSQAVLVRGGIPGETIRLAGVTACKGYQEAEVSEVITASADRVAVPCPVYESCGGCQWQHLRYEAQLIQKQQVLGETLHRVGRLPDTKVSAVIPSPSPFGYRSAVRFVVFRQGPGWALGLHREGSHEPVEAAGCLLVPDGMRMVIDAVINRLADTARLALRLDEVEIRRSVALGSTLLCFRTGPATFQQIRALFRRLADIPDITGIVIRSADGRRWVHGRDWIADRLHDLMFRIGDRSFMQANWVLNDTLSRTVSDWVDPCEGLRILELYAGIGSLGLPLAKRGALLTAVEGNPYASADARHAMRTNHIRRCRFRTTQAEIFLSEAGSSDYDLILVDPPRTGLTQSSIQGLLRVKVPRLLYLSCDAPTLARDLSRLVAGGYRIRRVQPFDMFPQTAHLETLVELT